MKREPIGPPPNRQTIEICLHLLNHLASELGRLRGQDLARLKALVPHGTRLLLKDLSNGT